METPPHSPLPSQPSLPSSSVQPSSSPPLSSSSSALSSTHLPSTSTPLPSVPLSLQLPGTSNANSIEPQSESTTPGPSSDVAQVNVIPPSPPPPEQSPYCRGLNRLLDVFVGTGGLTQKQVTMIYKFSGCDADIAAKCLSDGPTLESIKEMIIKRFEEFPRLKLDVDEQVILLLSTKALLCSMNHSFALSSAISKPLILEVFAA